jgi:hypothetical protein
MSDSSADEDFQPVGARLACALRLSMCADFAALACHQSARRRKSGAAASDDAEEPKRKRRQIAPDADPDSSASDNSDEEGEDLMDNAEECVPACLCARYCPSADCAWFAQGLPSDARARPIRRWRPRSARVRLNGL